jgi:hypothetical protein
VKAFDEDEDLRGYRQGAGRLELGERAGGVSGLLTAPCAFLQLFDALGRVGFRQGFWRLFTCLAGEGLQV